MKRETGFRTALMVVILVLCAIGLAPTVLVFTKSNDKSVPLEQRERELYKKEHPQIAAKAMNLGLDLAGGTHIIVEIDRSKMDESADRDVLDRTLEIVRNRVDQYGLSEPVITKSGDNRIIADLAGMGAEDARGLIGATALLEFKLVPEAQEFRPVLDRLDAFLAARGKGESPEQAAAAPARAASEAENVFGRVVGDTSAAVTVADTTTAAGSDSAAAAAVGGLDLAHRPFTSLLVSLGRDIGVAAPNVEKMRRILADKDVQSVIPSRYQFLWGRDEQAIQGAPGAQKVRRLYLLKRRAEMTGATIADANFQHAQGGLNSGELEVGLTFKGLGPKEFARVTGANIGRQLAIVLDSVVYSAPVIQGRIPNGRASITGVGNVNEAKQLAVILRAGALPVPMKIAELRSVGPTLGEQNIRKGLSAAVVALLLVAVFMVVYYRGAGLIANFALLFNMVILFAVLSAFHATLTLPGIAGIALTIGMAVDANVLIFERIREELRHGKSVRIAIDVGYKRAFSAILDSNITTLGTAAILYYIGVGPIKGFGLTLMIGLTASMYTAIGVTRLVFDYILSRRDVKELSIGHGFAWFHKVDMKVIPWARYYVGVSIAVTALAIGAIAVKGLNFGIDFTGGHVYQVHFAQTPDLEKVRKGVEAAGLEEPQVQTMGSAEENRVLVYLAKVKSDSSARVAIQQVAGPQATIESEDNVGPTVGKNLRMSAIWSILASLVLIVLYIWFRFGRNGLGFGLAGVLGLIHDSIITLGVFALLGRTISLDFVAAILTIIGYSLNDSIIIFDRIRELSADSNSKDSFAVRVNKANNQSLSRGVITHLTVFFTVLVLAVMGAVEVRDFSIAMIIGVVVGTYSTIAVACPFVVWWQARRTRVKA
ncbi:MAG TPA: protein translocase subunit SecD [Fibrobacteria bacterium]|jgi:SecD/SecF fusion protein|nr:protein translocase subunit SecD [Fibrobacteria bacterium]